MAAAWRFQRRTDGAKVGTDPAGRYDKLEKMAGFAIKLDLKWGLSPVGSQT